MMTRPRTQALAPTIAKPAGPESAPRLKVETAVPCAVCGHPPGDPLPPGMILRNARLASPKVGGLKVDEFLDLAGSTRSLSWFQTLENGRKTVPRWPEWVAL